MAKPLAAILILLFGLNMRPAAAAARDFDAIYEQMELCVESGDLVSLRILASRVAHRHPDWRQWIQVRDLLHRNPSAGWDILWKWDRLQLKDQMKSAQNEINKTWSQADAFMANRNFKSATLGYQKILTAMQADSKEFGEINFFARQTLLHSLARSLFGEGRFDESLETYQKISLLYPYVRQIQFEKMWAAFRAKNYSLTLGAIASQMSSYFNRYLEPETYLVQYYLYRQMCRKSDVAQVLRTVKRFKKILSAKRIQLEQWARFDLETMILLRLSRSKYSEATAMVSETERQAEVQRIRASLEKRYAVDIARVNSQLEKVVAYLNMATVAAKGELPAISRATDLKQILNSETEMWPVEDAEDWLDEIGHHHFVGVSECK